MPDSPQPTRGKPFEILTVCTGNIARSPLVAQLLSVQLALPRTALVVGSAGTGALVGEPMTEQAAELSRRYGGNPVHHRARQVTSAMVESADLVLTATRQHRSDVVSLAPRAARYAFTLRQFARLVESLDQEGIAGPPGSPTRLREVVRGAAGQRGFVAPLRDPDDDDLVDPFRQSQAIYDRVGAQIDTSVREVVGGLLGVRSDQVTAAQATRDQARSNPAPDFGDGTFPRGG